MPGEPPLAGRLALVTGAGRGIGAASAKALAAAGAHVVLTARTVQQLEEVEDDIHEAGGHSTIAPLDLAEPDAVGRLADAIAGRWDALDYLILSAAYLPNLTPVTQIDPKQFNQALLTNVVATQALIAAFDPLLKRAEAARVIGLTSSVGTHPRPFWAAYAASKSAFDNLLSSYAQENVNLNSIRVAILDPGATRTEMRARAYPGEDPATLKPPEEVATQILKLIEEGFETGHRARV